MADEGTITNVAEHVFGSELSADAVIGATSIFVVDIDEFDLDGGNLRIGTEVYAYTVPEDSEGEITIPTGLTTAYLAGERVEQSPQLVEVIAWVLSPEQEEELQVRVPHTLIDALPLGSRNGNGEQVEYDYHGEELVILDILGKPLTRDFSFGDPTTLPPPVTTDTHPPSSSPVPVVRGGIGSLVIQWDAIANADPVTYEVHVSATAGFSPTYVHPTPPATTPAKTYVTDTQGTLIFVRKLPDGSELEYEIPGAPGDPPQPKPYFVQVIAKDADGTAPLPHPESSGSAAQVTGDDIAVNAVNANHILTGTITADQLAATLILTNLIKTPTEEGQRVEIGAWDDEEGSGIRLIAQNGSELVKLPTDPGAAAEFKGFLEAASLTVYNYLSLRGPNNVVDGGVLTLSSQLANPVSPPKAAIDNETVPLGGLQPPFYGTGSNSTHRGFHFDPIGHGQPTLLSALPDTDSFSVGRGLVIGEHDLNGLVVDGPITLPAMGYSWERTCGITRRGAIIYVLAWGRALGTPDQHDLVVLRVRQADWAVLGAHPINKPHGGVQTDHWRSTISSILPAAPNSVYIWGFNSNLQGADIIRHEFTDNDTPAGAWTHAGQVTYDALSFGFDGRAGGDIIEGHVRVGSSDWISTDRDGVHGPISFATAGFTFESETGFISGSQGITYDTATVPNRFLSRAGARILRHSNWNWTTPNAYLSYAYAWRESDTVAWPPRGFDTLVSPQRALNVRAPGPTQRSNRRSRVKITIPDFPTGGTPPVTRFRLYMGHAPDQAPLSTTDPGPMWHQPAGSITTQTASPTYQLGEVATANPLQTNDWPGATSKVQSQTPLASGGWEITGTGHTGFGGDISCLATSSNAAMAATSGTSLVVTFNQERKTTASMHDNATNNSRIIAPRSGRYLVFGRVSWSHHGASYRQLTIRKTLAGGGATSNIALTTVNPVGVSPQPTHQQVGPGETLMATGDWIELLAFHQAGAGITLTLNATQPGVELGMVYLGP